MDDLQVLHDCIDKYIFLRECPSESILMRSYYDGAAVALYDYAIRCGLDVSGYIKIFDIE